mmetsp:Transcript_21438/g.36627  ORF Transcript_21438/g.36627 Transcript_21438/m.36627 type:complete len:174 (+) Transcript_21438:28-549(+)
MPQDVLSEYIDENNPTVGERVWYFINGLLVAAPPIYLYHSVFGINVFDLYWLYAVVSLAAAVVLSQAHHNVSYWLRTRLHSNREGTVTAAMINSAYGKNNKQKVESVKSGQKKCTHSESASFAILYNNLFFLFIFFVIGFYLFPSIPRVYNYAISVVGSAALVNFVSTQALKR